MIAELAFRVFLGLPLLAWGGLITLILMLTTAGMGLCINKGICNIDIRWHMRLAFTTIIFAALHGFIGLYIMVGK